MVEFFTNHWDSLLVCVVFAVVIATLLVRGKKDIVYKMLYALVTEAEEIYGSKAGKIKFAYVMEKAYGMLPAVVKLVITYDTLERWIEKVLAEAKEHWAEKAGIDEQAEITE